MLWGKKTGALEFATLPRPRGFSGRVQVTPEVEGASSAWEDSKESQVSNHGVLRIPPWSHRDALAGFFQNSTCQAFFCPKGDTLVQVGHTLILCMCTCACSYPTNHSPLSLLLSARRQSPHCQTSILPSAKAFPAIYLLGLVK